MTHNTLIIKDEDFWEVFQPKKNHLDDNAAYGGYMYSLGDDELEYVRSQKPKGIEFEVQDDNLKKQFIISVDTILHNAKDVLPDMDYGEAEDLYDNISDEIFEEANNAIRYRLHELQSESKNEGA